MPTHKPYTFAIRTSRHTTQIAKEYGLPPLSKGRKKTASW